MKDSRIGAFGVMALVFDIGIQVTAAYACLAKGLWLPLIVAPAYARGMVILFGQLVSPNPHSTLAALIQPGVKKTASLAALALTFVLAALCLNDIVFGATLLLTAVILYPTPHNIGARRRERRL
jgi:adenosylcobinamide-GDP ribazoletransferase